MRQASRGRTQPSGSLQTTREVPKETIREWLREPAIDVDKRLAITHFQNQQVLRGPDPVFHPSHHQALTNAHSLSNRRVIHAWPWRFIGIKGVLQFNMPWRFASVATV